MKHWIFLFCLSGYVVGRCIELRYSTHNASKIRRKLENGSVSMGTECLNTTFLCSLCLACYVWHQLKGNTSTTTLSRLYFTLDAFIVTQVVERSRWSWPRFIAHLARISRNACENSLKITFSLILWTGL